MLCLSQGRPDLAYVLYSLTNNERIPPLVVVAQITAPLGPQEVPIHEARCVHGDGPTMARLLPCRSRASEGGGSGSGSGAPIQALCCDAVGRWNWPLGIRADTYLLEKATFVRRSSAPLTHRREGGKRKRGSRRVGALADSRGGGGRVSCGFFFSWLGCVLGLFAQFLPHLISHTCICIYILFYTFSHRAQHDRYLSR